MSSRHKGSGNARQRQCLTATAHAAEPPAAAQPAATKPAAAAHPPAAAPAAAHLLGALHLRNHPLEVSFV